MNDHQAIIDFDHCAGGWAAAFHLQMRQRCVAVRLNGARNRGGRIEEAVASNCDLCVRCDYVRACVVLRERGGVVPLKKFVRMHTNMLGVCLQAFAAAGWCSPGALHMFGGGLSFHPEIYACCPCSTLS
mmetsp:Transcript_1626/g.3997  ORF Transcript_1626/g.3997 Transcript_1626/m.3997 type:complete len:129 (-) Transcript_1626:622-1008(-)|eukprot:385557-Pelagomonas_calceolata.AAC.1